MRGEAFKGHVAVLLANVIFGVGVPVTAILLSKWVTPNGYMLTRCAGAALIFWIIQCFLPKEQMTLRDWITIVVGGLIGIVVSQLFTAWSLVYTTPTYYAILATLVPVATMLGAALFLKERITGMKIVGVVLAIIGALIIVLHTGLGESQGKNDLLGIGLGFLSLITWVIYLLITRNVSARYNPVTQMKWVFLASALVMLPMTWGEFDQQTLYSPAWQWSGVIAMAFIVICATVLGYFAIPYAMRRLDATTVSTYTNLQPIVTALIAITIGQDVLTWDKPVALIIVLVGAYLVTMKND